MTVDQDGERAGLVRKAINLFTFLSRAQQLLVKPIRTVDKFDSVIWFSDLPDHPAVQSSLGLLDLEMDAPLVVVERVAKLEPPQVPDELAPWVDGPTEDSEVEPVLRDAIVSNGRRELSDHPEISTAFENWIFGWRLWADQDRRDTTVRDLYKSLFELQLKSADHSEEFELVVGVGCLSWKPVDHERVLRHVTTAPIAIEFDENTGTLAVTRVASPESLSVETDMLDPTHIPSPGKLDEIRQLAAEYSGHVLDAEAVGDVCRRLVLRLDPDAHYDDEIQPPTGADPKGAFAPAIILRRRTNRGLVQIYDDIVAQIQSTGEIPAGVLPLIDPDRQPESETSGVTGAVVTLDGEDFLPLPVNDTQRRIIERVDTTAQTVVQGPPGTGKTHTAAALVSHLLAQGKRILITAHTDRALREVRSKLPSDIQALAVSVIGQSRSDMAELRTAVDSISKRADDFEPVESQSMINGHLATLDRLRRQRAELHARLVSIRQQEVEPRHDGPADGTVAAIAYQHLQDEPLHDWIREFQIGGGSATPPVSDSEIKVWRTALLDEIVIVCESEASERLVDTALLAAPDDFAQLVAAERFAVQHRDQFQDILAHSSFEFVWSLPASVRNELRSRVTDLAEAAAVLENRDEVWIADALRDVRTDKHHTWVARSAQIKELAGQCAMVLQRLGQTTQVVVADSDIGVHEQVAKSLLAYVQSGEKIKTLPDGSPKVGAFSSKTVKLAAPFFERVKVNGVPAVTAEKLTAFLDWVMATRLTAALAAAWPSSVQVPAVDTLVEKLLWHRTEVAQLDKVLALGAQLSVERTWFRQNNLPEPDWTSLNEIRRYAKFVEAASAADGAAAATSPIATLADYLRGQAHLPNAPKTTHRLLLAVEDRDLDAYSTTYHLVGRLSGVADSVAERDRIRATLNRTAPRLAQAIAGEPASDAWNIRLASFAAAWQWYVTGQWIMAQDSEDSNVLKAQLNEIEREIRSEVEHLAAERAWGHAVAPGRLTGSARANLTQYAQLVAKLGKGTGKYAAKQRVEIAEAMDRCRPAVPVWIMPIYRIAEQLRVQPNLYDVVIVDEASQAGLEATFLQYLAPKLVVIGDDKQVSPSAVGVDQQQLRDLANQYLGGDPYIASWQDPKRSYFDEASMRFGGRITLTEHRRCVPEIIGFSNHIAYEPEGIRLIPVRQFGAERLVPIKVVHVRDGYEGTNKTNPAEADAIVEQIQQCIAAPEYDRATFGVISLLGKDQAKLIENKLLDVVDPEEWAKRELRCGDASDFQGSERDVMFLSMVKTHEPGKRLTPLTATMYVQRYNVAASRAKDQMWVYHSMSKNELTNSEDMRFQLLDYCYGIANRTNRDVDTPTYGVVPEDRLVTPFDSLFEQRIFNRILDRGYTVIPQYAAIGYKIDLVIVGAKGRLAVECDGDFWHGPAQYEGDLARQRELERCGWKFFRIRESTFYADMASTLKLLWDMLYELDIHPSEWIDPSVAAEETTAVEDLIDEIYDEADAQIDRPPTDIGPPPEQFSGVGRYENS